jgi:hypothetical protein
VTPRGGCGLLLAVLAAGLTATAQAQPAAGAQGTAASPGTRQMIEALKPADGRGRNLVVGAAGAPPGPPPPPPPLPPPPPAI